MKDSLKKGLSNFPNSKEVEGLKDEWDRVINGAKRVKLNTEYLRIQKTESQSVSLKIEESQVHLSHQQKKLDFGKSESNIHEKEKQTFDEIPSFDLGIKFYSNPGEEVTLCKSLENVNLTPPEEKPNLENVEIISLLTPPEESQMILEFDEIQASTEEFNAANALFSMSKNPM